jgi:hypothetical protein
MGCCGSYLTAGQTLRGGDYLLSPNGQYSAVMQDDGNFVLYWGRWPDRVVGPMWASDTGGKSGVTATMQTDGNLVLNGGGWMTGTGGRSGPLFAAMQDNGDFALWLGTPAAPTSYFYTTGTWQGTLAVEVDGPYRAHVTVSPWGNDTGTVKQGRTNRGMVHFPAGRSATATFSVVLGSQSFAVVPLGARRSLLYTMGGTSLNPTAHPTQDHGPF